MIADEIQDEEEFLKSRGWSTWYHHDYWVHPKTIKDKSRQDYTDYGLSMQDAVKYELENMPPWSGQPIIGFRI